MQKRRYDKNGLMYIGVLLLLVLMFSSCREVVPPLPPSVSGVEDGMVYGVGMVIDLRSREEGVVYSATINGEPFPLGDYFEQEGDHTLQVIAVQERGKLTAETTLHFEIDKVPPPVPEVTGVESGRTYPAGVQAFVLEEEGVTYSAIINEEEYTFGAEFQQEGEHLLTVYALKDRNGLTSATELPFSINRDRYTEEEAAYFHEIAFGGEFGGDITRIKKWQGDIRVKVQGDPTERDLNTLTRVMEELNTLIEGVQIGFSDERPNFHVHFIPHREFLGHTEEKIARENLGLFFYFERGGGVISSAKVLIASDKATEEERAHLLREEFTQALGLAQDSWRYVDSIFYQGWTTTQEFSEMDRRIISMLYHPDIKPNMEKQRVKEYFEEKRADVNARAQVFPVDQGPVNPSFVQFRNELLQRIEDRDLAYILAHVDEQFYYHPLSSRGIQAFRDIFLLDIRPEETPLWDVLYEGVTLGGVFLNAERSIFEAPYTKARFPRGLNPYTYKVAMGGEISMHEQPVVTSPVIGLLRYDVVKWLPPVPAPVLPDDLVSGESFQWEYVETLGGLRGYVQTGHLRRPTVNIITFEPKEDRWMITSVTN